MIQQSILRNRLAGLGKNHKTAVFPKLVFAIREGINRRAGDVNYDIKQLALACASKRMYPDILNYDQVVSVTGSFKTPMGCRSFLGVYEENGKQIHEGRNNIGVISLNLPRIALEAGGDDARFWSLLDERLALAKQALMTRVARLEKPKPVSRPFFIWKVPAVYGLMPMMKSARFFATDVLRYRWAISACMKRSMR